MTDHDFEQQVRANLREALDRELGPDPTWAESPAARRVAEVERRSRRRWPLRALAVAALIGAGGGAALLGGRHYPPPEESPAPSLIAVASTSPDATVPSPSMRLFDSEDITSLVPQDGDFDGADYTFSVARCPGGASLEADLGLEGRGSVGMLRDDSTEEYPFIFGAWVNLWADAAAASAALASECPWSQQPVLEPIELPAGGLGDGGRCAVIDWGTLADRGWCQFAVSNATFEMYIRTNTNGTDLHPDAAADLAALAVALKERAEGLATGP